MNHDQNFHFSIVISVYILVVSSSVTSVVLYICVMYLPLVFPCLGVLVTHVQGCSVENCHVYKNMQNMKH